MKKILILFIILFSFNALQAHDAEIWKRRPKISSWMQYGFRIGTSFSLTSQYSETDKLTKLVSAEFGAYARFGKYVYGEIGLGYLFHKGTYECPNLPAFETSERVESRFLQIPLKAVGYLTVGKRVALLPTAGILYQPLIQVTKNEINYNKNTITRHQFLFTAGLGIKIHFVTIDFAYRQNISPFFSDRKSAKPNYLSLMLGFQL